MTHIKPSKFQTVVGKALFTLAVIAGIQGARSIGFAESNTVCDPGPTIEMACKHKAAGAEYDACVAENRDKVLASCKGDNLENKRACTESQTTYNKSVADFTKACSGANVSADACIDRAKKCSAVRESDETTIDPDEDYESMLSGDIAEMCSSRDALYKECPELILSSTKDFDEAARDAAKDFDDKAEKMNDLVDQYNEAMKDSTDDQAKFDDLQTQMSNQQQQAFDELQQRLKDMKVSLDEATAKTFLDIDNIDMQIATALADQRKTANDIAALRTGLIAACDKEGKEAQNAKEAEIRLAKIAGKNFVKSFKKLQQSTKWAKMEYDKYYMQCMTRAGTQGQQQDLLRRGDEKAVNVNTTVMMLEKKRGELLSSIKGSAIQNSINRDEEARRYQQLTTSLTKNLGQIQMRNFQNSGMKQQRMTELQQRVAESSNLVSEYKKDLQRVQRDRKCADYSKSQSGGGGSITPEKYAEFLGAVGLFDTTESNCVAMTCNCINIYPQPVACNKINSATPGTCTQGPTPNANAAIAQAAAAVPAAASTGNQQPAPQTRTPSADEISRQRRQIYRNAHPGVDTPSGPK